MEGAVRTIVGGVAEERVSCLVVGLMGSCVLVNWTYLEDDWEVGTNVRV